MTDHNHCAAPGGSGAEGFGDHPPVDVVQIAGGLVGQ